MNSAALFGLVAVVGFEKFEMWKKEVCTEKMFTPLAVKSSKGIEQELSHRSLLETPSVIDMLFLTLGSS